MERAEEEAARPKFALQTIHGTQAHIQITTPSKKLEADIYQVVARVTNEGTRTAIEARPYFYYSETGKHGTVISWAVEDVEANPFTVETQEEVPDEPEAIAEFLRHRLFVRRRMNVDGGEIVPVILAFAVKGSKSIVVPTTYPETFALPHVFKDISLAIGMQNERGSKELHLDNFVFFEWNRVGLETKKDGLSP